MISVDISNIWGEVSLPGLLAIESEVAAAHEMLMEGTGAGNTFREWLNLPSREPNPEIFRILQANIKEICKHRISNIIKSRCFLHPSEIFLYITFPSSENVYFNHLSRC